MSSCAVIFGGTGFIGSYFALHLFQLNRWDKVYLYDLESIDEKSMDVRTRVLQRSSGIQFVRGDIRNEVEWRPPEKVNLIANFAAIHREPGHADYEYYETNLLGASNVCSWAQLVGCETMIFTSSIAPYGPSERRLDEESIPCPETAYGSSKLSAEKIHEVWQASDSSRKLTIVRPGVVYGPGEGGNVSRLIRAVRGRYFFYMGNRETRKAGVYIKELCLALTWVAEWQEENKQSCVIFNMSMRPGPSVKEYVDVICKVLEIRVFIPTMPSAVLMFIATIADGLAKMFGIAQPLSPVRIKKLQRSNNIYPGFLEKAGYCYKYTLEESMRDWKEDAPEEWH